VVPYLSNVHDNQQLIGVHDFVWRQRVLFSSASLQSACSLPICICFFFFYNSIWIQEVVQHLSHTQKNSKRRRRNRTTVWYI